LWRGAGARNRACAARRGQGFPDHPAGNLRPPGGLAETDRRRGDPVAVVARPAASAAVFFAFCVTSPDQPVFST
jgi:hypothetical protein